MKIADLGRWRGKLNRSTYFLTGLILVAIKHNVDRLIASIFGQKWTLWSYWFPVEKFSTLRLLSGRDKEFLITLFLTATPFIWVGLVLTVKRLRDAELAPWLATLFFAPFVNVIFFAVMCVIPSQAAGLLPSSEAKPVGRYWPTTKWGSAALGVVVAVLLGVICTWVGVRWLGNYGFSLFLALPFAMGYIAVWVHAKRNHTTGLDVVILVSLTVLLCGLGIATIAIEGLICLAMAAPIAWVAALFGGMLAAAIHRQAWGGRTMPIAGVVLASVPLLMGAEHLSPPPVPRFEVLTSIEIAAPPQIVWSRLIQFPALPPPTEWPFRYARVAYPIEARLTGEGLTADRECRFSTGSFKEPILAWEPDKRFAFGVSDEPLLMTETSPYGQIHVRHLDDHDFQPERADFVLTSLPNGGTRLEGTTTYTNKMWPAVYWHLWTDAVVHSIHRRVFEHVKRLAEADAQAEAARVSDNTR